MKFLRFYTISILLNGALTAPAAMSERDAIQLLLQNPHIVPAQGLFPPINSVIAEICKLNDFA